MFNWNFNKFKTDYRPQRSKLFILVWYFLNTVIFQTKIFPFSGVKLKLLKMFGAKVGTGCLIKPGVNIKFPWELELADCVWIGENVWIDNLAKVKIGNHVCISQGALILTGMHDIKSDSFDTFVQPIEIGNQVWIGANANIAPGVSICDGVVISMGSAVLKSIQIPGVYQGNPARQIMGQNEFRW